MNMFGFLDCNFCASNLQHFVKAICIGCGYSVFLVHYWLYLTVVVGLDQAALEWS